MKTLRSVVALAIFAAVELGGVAGAEEPPGFTFSPVPPGAVVQSSLVYLAGEAMHTQWRTVLSKKHVGIGTDGTAFYQWYLSIYAIDGATYHLKYQSPRDGGPLTVVAKASNAQLWFPVQSAKIVGVGEFMGAAAQQVVVQAHEFAADCGSSTVAVFAYDPKGGKPFPSAVATNGCELSASVVRAGELAALRLSGPYYGRNAAMCCPTKPKATATLKYLNGRWTEKPNYFPLKAR